MYEHYSPATLRIFCNPFYYPHKFFKKFHKTLVNRLTRAIQPPKQKNPLTVASQGMKRGDNHKPPEEKQMSIFACWP